MLSVTYKPLMLSIVLLNVIFMSVVMLCVMASLLGLDKFNHTQRGVRLLMGENLEVVWAEFSTLSLAVLLDNTKNGQLANGHI